MALFGKKNNADAGEEGEPDVKKNGALGRIKKRLKISISLKRPPKAHEEEKEPEIGLRAGFTDDDPQAKDEPDGKKKAKKEKKPKEPKEPKEKKTKEKKQKKEKPPKKKGPEDSPEDGEKEKPEKSRKLMMIIIGGAGVAVGAAAFAVYAFFFAGPSLAEQLMTAQLLLEETKYDEAEAAFTDIVEQYDDSALAYVGLAEAKLGKTDTEGALQTLNDALPQTGNDQLILDKIDEINSEGELPDDALADPAEQEPPPPTDTPIVFADAAFGDMLRIALGKAPGEPVSQAELADITTLKILGATHAAIKRGEPYMNSGGAARTTDISFGPEVPESEAMLFGPESGEALTFGKEPAGVLLYGQEPEEPAREPAGEAEQEPAGEAQDSPAESSGGDVRWTPAPVSSQAGVASENVLQAINSLDGYTIDGVKYTGRGGITSLADLVNFRSLRKLTIGYNSIDDLKGIEGLRELDTLGLYCNSVVDIAPVKGLYGLKYVYLYNNGIADISPLRELSGIEDLWLNYNQISDIAPLGELAPPGASAALHTLHIGNNSISDISPLEGLSNLYVLGAAGNRISDVSALGGLRNLSSVTLSGNPVADYSPVSDIFNLVR